MINNRCFDLLVFDFDGTLTDSIPPAIDAIQKMLSMSGYPFKSKEEINKFVGFGEIPLISGSIGTEDPEKIQAAMKIYFKNYMENGLKHIKLYPNVRNMLEALGKKKKVIISNKRDEFIRKILDYHKLAGCFDEVLGGDSAPCLKPDPCAINKIIKDNNIKLDRVLFVGDMTVDIETGKNAGVYTCAVTYGFDSREKLEKLNPDYIIDDAMELTKIVR